MYAFVPVWATEQNISATAVGLLLALRAAVSVLRRLGLMRLIARFGRKEQPPRAAVDEHLQRCIRAGAAIEVERLGIRRPVTKDLRLPEARASTVAVLAVAADHLGGIRCPRALIVLAIELLLVVVAKDRHSPPSGRAGT